ncbi:unnamed protein product, partial [Gulo gulo]
MVHDEYLSGWMDRPTDGLRSGKERFQLPPQDSRGGRSRKEVLRPELVEMGEGATSTPLPRAPTHAETPKSSRCVRFVGTRQEGRCPPPPGPGHWPDHNPQ